MKVLAFPLRLGADGAFASVEQGSAAQAEQLARVVLCTVVGERALAPDFGLLDRVGVGLSAGEVRAAVALCEPGVVVDSVTVGVRGDRQRVEVSVGWEAEDGL